MNNRGDVLWAVVRKESVDAFRDRRTWLVVLITSVLTGPIVLLLLTGMIGDLKQRAERREIMMVNAPAAPRLVNYLQRQGLRITNAPANYEQLIIAGRFDEAVVVVPDDFTRAFDTGDAPKLRLIYDENRNRSVSAARAAREALRGFSQEVAQQRLLARGISGAVLAPVRVEQLSLSGSKGQLASMLFLVPFIAMFAALAGAMTVAIDVTAGERERGSLEPLLMNPIAPIVLVTGKWVAVSLAALMTLTLTLASFAGAARLINDEALAAVFQFGWAEAGLFVIVLGPFCCLMAAFLMSTAIFARSYKEAQAYTSYTFTGVALATALPMYLSLPDAFWQLFVPAIGQNMVLTRALRGSVIGVFDIALPALIAIAITALLLLLQARLLQRESIIFARG